MSDPYERALIENSFVTIIHKNLGEKSLDVIRKRLFEKYGLSLNQAVNDEYSKLFDILKENFTESGANNIEKQFRKTIITTSHSGTKGKPVEKIISNPEIVKKILKFIGDQDMMMILNDAADKPKLVSEIIKTCNLPQTSGYRKINQLVDAGMLVINGFVVGTDGRQIFKYTTSYESLTVLIDGKKSKLKIIPKKTGKNKFLPIPFV